MAPRLQIQYSINPHFLCGEGFVRYSTPKMFYNKDVRIWHLPIKHAVASVAFVYVPEEAVSFLGEHISVSSFN